MRAYFNLSFEREGVDEYDHDYDREGLALAERTGDQQWRRSFLMHLSFAAFELGDWDTSLRLTAEAQESPGAAEDIFSHGIVLNRANVLARRGDVAAAREALESVGFDETVPDDQNRAMLWTARAEVLAGEGRYADAAAAAHESMAIHESMGLGHPAIKAGMILETWCAFRAGDRGPAEEALARFADEPLARQSPRVSAHLALLRAMLAAPADAPAAHAASVEAARAGGAPWNLALALAEQANAGVDREAALAECAAILERLGAAAALERLAEPALRDATRAAG
jgi:hypothetical protein